MFLVLTLTASVVSIDLRKDCACPPYFSLVGGALFPDCEVGGRPVDTSPELLWGSAAGPESSAVSSTSPLGLGNLFPVSSFTLSLAGSGWKRCSKTSHG